MTAEEFLLRRAELWRIRRELETRENQMRSRVIFPPLSKLEPAKDSDIKVGAIIYYPDGQYWQIVEEVRHPGDSFKAYTAEDGCRYGLQGAFVRRRV